MPNTDGESTLRDVYPIFCDVCKTKIVINDYFLTGMYMGPDEIPVSRYSHRACLPQAKYATTTYARPLGPGAIFCLYCGAATDSMDFTCDACRQRIKDELRQSAATEAVKELLRKLAEASMRPYQHGAADTGSTPQGRPTSSYPPSQPRERPNPAATLVDMGATEPELTPFVPTNENGVIFMLGGILSELRYRMVAMPNQYPDAVLYSPSGKFINVEFEFRASNFIAHKHDPKLCDLVICWQGDRDLPVPVLALEQHYNAHTGRWNFRDAAASTN